MSPTQPTQPSCPSWALRAWPLVLWQVDQDFPLQLEHLGTQITAASSSSFRALGQTLWARPTAQGHIGLAWDWVALDHGVVAMADPLAVVTNVRLVDADGDDLPALALMQHVNTLVNRLPWQREVGRVLAVLAGDADDDRPLGAGWPLHRQPAAAPRLLQ